ncbi:hypothetical protein HDV06_000004 [Boothiomyces sp. JEL0866]|nr:hypothetical protein HDV06_000004 [Boothiomyces sp. JEL0866]
MSSNVVFQSGWLNSFDCTGPASTMYVFSEDSPTVLYSNVQTDSPIPACGSSTGDVPDGCCISSLDLTFTDSYQSMMRSYVLDSTDYKPPASSNSFTYCTITSNTNSSLYGYYQAFFLANGKCQDNVMCNINSNLLTVFNNTGCTGPFEQYYTTDSSPRVSNLLGNVSFGIYIVHNATETITWTGFTPQYELVPQFKVPVEQFAIFCYIVALLVGICTCLYYGRRYLLHKTFRDLIFSITQFLITMNIILQCVYYTTVLSDTQLEEIDLAVQVFGSYSLFSVYVSLHVLFTIFVEFQNSMLKILVFAFLTIMNLGTMYYFAIADIYSLTTGNYDEFYFQLVRLQYNCQVYWKTVYFVIEIVPSTVILFKMIYGANNKKLQKVMPKVFVIVILALFQIVIILGFEVFNLIRTYTLWLGNDRILLASNAINYLLQAINSLLILVVYEKLVELVESMANRKPKPIKMAVTNSVTKMAH